MIQISNKSMCCGCGACHQACPCSCIKLIADSEGFLYPEVEKSSCIDCGLCEKVCPMLNPGVESQTERVFATINPDDEVRDKSSSGGVFSQLAQSVISDGGVVFGARFNEYFGVMHSSTESLDGVAEFRGSKYLQSEIGECYKEAEALLKQGRRVLFSGTPCQIRALKCYLRRDYDNLLLVDSICHGVPSPKVWQHHLKEVGKEVGEGAAICGVNFRDKRSGWRSYSHTLNFVSNEGKIEWSRPYNSVPFMRLFLADYTLRPSCYNCKAKAGSSGSGITIADCWGIHKTKTQIDYNRGATLVILHNGKYEEYFSQNPQSEFSQRLIRKYNPSYYKSPHRPADRDELFTLLDSGATLSELAAKYAPTKKGFKRRMEIMLKSVKLLLTPKK